MFHGWAELTSTLASSVPVVFGVLFLFWSFSLLQASSLARGSFVQSQERSTGTPPPNLFADLTTAFLTSLHQLH